MNKNNEINLKCLSSAYFHDAVITDYRYEDYKFILELYNVSEQKEDKKEATYRLVFNDCIYCSIKLLSSWNIEFIDCELKTDSYPLEKFKHDMKKNVQYYQAEICVSDGEIILIFSDLDIKKAKGYFKIKKENNWFEEKQLSYGEAKDIFKKMQNNEQYEKHDEKFDLLYKIIDAVTESGTIDELIEVYKYVEKFCEEESYCLHPFYFKLDKSIWEIIKRL